MKDGIFVLSIFVINPTAGKSDSTAVIEKEVKSRMDSSQYIIYRTTGRGDATRFVREFLSSHTEPVRIFACGGDGTLNEVVNGAVGCPNAAVGIYPCGSGNDFVKYYGGKEAFLDFDSLLCATEHKIDLLKVGDKYSVNVDNFGLDAYVCNTMIQVKQKPLIGGKNAYYTGVLKGFVKAMHSHCQVKVDGEIINPDNELLLCTVANCYYVGGAFKCAPRALNDDGLLEVCLIKPISRLKFISLLVPYTKGEHLESPKFKDIMVYRRGKKVEVSAPAGFLNCVDGEIIEENRFTIEVAPRAVSFLVPAAATLNVPVKEEALKQ